MLGRRHRVASTEGVPKNTDLFRLSDFESMFIGTERFVDAVRRLSLDEVDIRELPVR